jgi:hypothetical protein
MHGEQTMSSTTPMQHLAQALFVGLRWMDAEAVPSAKGSLRTRLRIC